MVQAGMQTMEGEKKVLEESGMLLHFGLDRQIDDR